MTQETKVRSIDVNEKLWVLMYSVLVLVLTSLPYFIGFYTESPDWRFSGFVFNVEDGNSYIAKMLRGASGDWLFRSPYTYQEQSGVLAFFPYILLGKLASGAEMHTQLVVLYHLFRWMAGLFVMYSTYAFLALFVKSIWIRRLGLVLASLGGGLGWILVIVGRSQWLGSMPLEYYSPETFGFLSIYGIPHLAMARGMLLSALRMYMEGHPNQSRGAVIGLIGILAGLFQPLSVVILGLVIGLHLLVSYKISRTLEGIDLASSFDFWNEKFKDSCIAGLFLLPFIIYNLVALKQPYVKQWTEQNIILSPHPFHYLLAYGGVLPLSIVGGRRVLADKDLRGMLTVIWVLMLPILAYFPFNLQRRLPDGVWVALLSLFLYGVESLNKEAIRKWVSVVLLVMLLPTSFFLLAGGVQTALAKEAPVFVPGEQVAAFKFLANNARVDSVVLSSYSTGNALPAWAPLRVVIGHGPESVGLKDFQPIIERFYSSEMNSMERMRLLSQFSVDYVYWGKNEGHGKLIAMDPLRIIYDQRGEKVYWVER